MKVTARGWNRNMGENVIGDHVLTELPVRRDPSQSLNRSKPTIFKSFGEVSVQWVQTLRYTGDYRVEVNLTRSDVVRLFKAIFGSELDVDLLDEHGFTVSPELQRSLIGKIKLADLTIGDLAGLSTPSTKEAEPEETPATVRPFLRRV